jgi:hypothetical protein
MRTVWFPEAVFFSLRRRIGRLSKPFLFILRIDLQFRTSLQSKVENPLLTMESFSRQFQLNKEEKETVAWGWNREGGETMFHVVNAYTSGAQFEELSAESSYCLQKVGGEILEMVQ